MVERIAAPADGENLFDKYAKGARILVEGAKTSTGQTPKEIVWSKNKAKLYHYEPGREDDDISFEDLVLDYMPRAVKKVLRNSHQEELTLFGYCQGGCKSLMYASLFPEGLKNLILLATPVDCSPEHTKLYGLWFDEKNHDPNVIVNSYGSLPA